MGAFEICKTSRSLSSWLKVATQGFGSIRRFALRAALLMAGIGPFVGAASSAQTAYLASGSPITLSGAFNAPMGVAVDANGNIFVADTGNNAVEELVAASGYTIKNLASGSFNAPRGVALDAYGNLFVADTGSSTVKVVSVASGYTTVSTLVPSGTFSPFIPTGVAIDKNGSLWTSNTDNAGHLGYLEFFSADGYRSPQVALGLNSTDPSPGVALDSSDNLFVGTTSAVVEIPPPGYDYGIDVAENLIGSGAGLAADASGNIFVADPVYNAVEEILSASANPNLITLGSGFNQPFGVAVDAHGNVFVADTGNNAVKEIPAGSASLDFAPVAVGTTTPPTATYVFVFTSGGTIGTPAVLTQGASGEDFTDAGTGTCTTNGPSHLYATDETCTVDVTFSPKHPGDRYGAIQLLNSSGAPMVTVLLHGMGSGPQITFAPGTQSTLGSGFSAPQGIAVDGSGNVIVGDTGNNAVKEISASTVRTLGSDFSGPQGVAVDGAGDIFVADTGHDAVKEIVAVNGVIPASPTVNTLGSGFNAPTAVAIDASGNVIVNDSGNGVLKEILADGGYTVVNTLSGSFKYPVLRATDASGNVFKADTANNRVQKMDLADPPQLTFAPTAVGSTSADNEQTVMVSNIGDQALNFPVPGTGNNASVSSGFTLQAPSTCPLLSNSSAPATLDPGSTCTYVVSFNPASAGTYNGSLILTDDNLNANSTQTLSLTGSGLTAQTITFTPPPSPVTFGVAPIPLTASATSGLAVTFSVVSGPGSITGNTLTVTGTGSIVIAANQAGDSTFAAATEVQQTITSNQATSTVSWAQPAAITFGTALSAAQLNATLNVPGGCTYSPALGTVLGAGTQTLTATCTPNDPADYTVPSPVTVSLTVHPAQLTVTASSASVAFGAPVPAITASYAGFVNGEGASALTTLPSCTTTYTTSSPAGAYPTTCSGGQAANYTIGYVPGVVTVGLASQSITFTAPATPVIFGAAPAALSASSSSGLPINFSAVGACAVVGNSLVYTSAGNCTVVASQAGNSDYSAAAAISYSVVVDQASPTITWPVPDAISYGTALSATQLDAVANVAGTLTYTATPTAGSPIGISNGTVLPVGSYLLTATFAPADVADYAGAIISVPFTVNPATSTIRSLSPAYVSAGGAGFTLTVTGTNFTSNSAVYWGSTALSTTYVSDTQLTASVTAAQIATEGIAGVSVLSADGNLSNAFQFAIDTASSTGPTMTVTTATVSAGGTATYSFTAPTNATILSASCLNLPAGASCSYSSGANAITITTSPATLKGTYQVTVVFIESAKTTSAGFLLPIFLLPLLLVRKNLRSRAGWFTACLALILLAGSFLATGCSNNTTVKTTSLTTTNTRASRSQVVTLIVD